MPPQKLTTYRKKRDFEKTSEPSGDVKVAPSKQRRFVIQKHDATRLHYDLRLEFDGVFKSWAVTRGPSLDPHDKRLAVEVEDHPLDYGDFEGTIPEDQYGGGTVQLWDRGYWDSTDPERGFAKGDLKFNLHGDKLQGSWVLVRMKGDRYGGKRTNWLLIKHRDEYRARRRRQRHSRRGPLRRLRPHDGRDRGRQGQGAKAVHAGQGQRPKRMRPGIPTAAPRPKRAPKTQGGSLDATGARLRQRRFRRMPDFVPPQLCASVERPPSGAAGATKSSSTAIACSCASRTARSRSTRARGSTGRTSLPRLRRRRSGLPDALIDGEIVAVDHNGLPDFSALQAAISDGKTDNLIYFAFDLLFADGEDLRALPLRERKERLKHLLEARKGKAKLIRYVEHFEEDGETVLQSAKQLSLEGIISKKLDAPYHSGRSESWTKAKCRAGHEVVIGGWKTDERQVPLADGRRLSRRPSRLCRHRRHRLSARTRCGG